MLRLLGPKTILKRAFGAVLSLGVRVVPSAYFAFPHPVWALKDSSRGNPCLVAESITKLNFGLMNSEN